MVEGWTVSPRKSRKKSACFLENPDSAAGAGEQQTGHHPGGPTANDEKIVVSHRLTSLFSQRRASNP
jgi:hypothetical protein